MRPKKKPTRRTHLLTLISGCAAAVAAAWPAQAAQDVASLSLEELLSVKVVGASKYEQDINDVAASVWVITREDIRTFGWRTIEEALASLPGVHTTYDRQYQYLGMRGFGLPGDFTTRVLVTVNGNRLNEPVYDGGPTGRQLPIDLALVERIEVISGPGGAVYGQNAMFGVVNLVLRDGAAVGGTEVAAGAQSLARLGELRATWGGKLEGGLDVLLSATYAKARGQDLYMDYGAAGVAGVATDQDGMRDREFYGRVGRGPWSAELIYGAVSKDDPTGVFLSDPLVPGQYQGDDYLVAQWQYRKPILDNEADLLVRVFAGEYRFRAAYSYTTWYEGPATGSWQGVEARLLWIGIPDHKLMLGVEAQNNSRTDQFFHDLADPANDVTVQGSGWRAGLYLQDEWQISEQWSTTLGGRIDHNDRTGTQASPRAALIWRASPATTIKAMTGRAFRAPNSYERDYDDGISQVANPALAGERIDTLELVGDHRIGRHTQLRAAAYQWTMRDIVKLGIDPVSGISQYQSGGNVDAHGLELAADHALDSGVRLRGSLSWQHLRTEAGDELPNSPRRMAAFQASAPLAGSGLRIGYEFRAETSRLTENGTRVGGYGLSNLTLGARSVAPGVDLSISFKNLFDKRYAHPAADTNWQNSLPQDGRSVWFELQARF